MDTGLDVTHPDLAPNLWVNSGEIPGNGVDDDRNGVVDDVNGFNGVDGSGNITVCALLRTDCCKYADWLQVWSGRPPPRMQPELPMFSLGHVSTCRVRVGHGNALRSFGGQWLQYNACGHETYWALVAQWSRVRLLQVPLQAHL